jgi:NhaA family Na+:H+ antiporter
MPIKTFLKHESASGILLIIAAVLALVLDNSPLAWLYDGLLSTPLAVQVGSLIIHKPFLLWINDGLMAIFFFLIGLEIKREVVEGELSSLKQATLPIIAAFGGLLLPALIYMYFNHADFIASRGWGVPVATDIAFALGIVSLLGDRIPRNLKILLLSLAIIDDICAILIIALFYTENLSFLALSFAAIGVCCAVILNRAGVVRIAPYVLIGIFMWVCVLKSGIHATLAGVVLALTIPIKSKDKEYSPLRVLEHNLHPWVAYFIMPLFAFTNAGVSLKGVSLASLTEPISMGIIMGLFLGKQLGVMVFVGLAVSVGICKLPKDVSWAQVYGLALLCGIGFTMSLFIGTLAFDDPELIGQVRISVLIASLLSAVCGYTILRLAKKG